MKSIFSLIIVASLLLVACNDNNDHDSVSSEETQSVFLKFNPSTNTRSNEATADGTSARFESALIYFLDNSTDPVVYDVRKAGNYAGSTLNISGLTAGVELTGIPSSVTQIYIVGNFNSADADDNTATFPMTTGTTLSTIQASMIDIHKMTYERINGHTYNEILSILDGSADIVAFDSDPSGWTGAGTPASGDYYANVSISPISARIEIDQLKHTGTLTSFTVEGIYINNFYADAPLSLQAAALGLAPIDNGSTIANYDSTDSSFAYTYYTTLYDTVAEAVAHAGSPDIIAPASGVWAYHVFGNQTPVHIVIKLTDVVDSGGNNLGDRYLTVKGFKDGSTSQELTELTRGTIYQISSLDFTESNLQILPETDHINIWVQVEVTPWTTVSVSPIM